VGSNRNIIGKLAIAAAVALTIGAMVFALTPRHLENAVADPSAAQAAESALLHNFNAQHFDAIYAGAADELKVGVRHNAAILAMKTNYARYGTIAIDKEALTTCYHEQVRMVRWWTSAKGDEATATFIWYVPEGQPAQLLMASLDPGHAPVDSAAYQTHRCETAHEPLAASG
jgi:hypothetical protein